jgi:hypothetical protein
MLSSFPACTEAHLEPLSGPVWAPHCPSQDRTPLYHWGTFHDSWPNTSYPEALICTYSAKNPQLSQFRRAGPPPSTSSHILLSLKHQSVF